MCPRDENSWCKYYSKQADTNYKEKVSLSEEIFNVLKPLFTDLSKKLLNKCLHGKTQNANEAINQVIWKRCPKDVFVNRSTLEIGVNSAVLQFNDGPIAITSVFKEVGITGSVTANKATVQQDQHKRKCEKKIKRDRQKEEKTIERNKERLSR